MLLCLRKKSATQLLPIEYKMCMIVNITIIADISLQVQIASGTILRQN